MYYSKHTILNAYSPMFNFCHIIPSGSHVMINFQSVI